MRKTALSLGVVLILAACGGAADTTTTTATTVPTSTTTTAPTTTTTAQPTTTTTLDPEWWSTDEARSFAGPPFRAPRFPELRIRAYRDRVIEARSNDGYIPVYHSEEDVDYWLSLITENDYLVVTEKTDTAVGGRPATSMRVDLPAGSGAGSHVVCGEPCVVMFDEGIEYGWAIYEGFPNLVWIVGVDEGTIVIFAEATDPSSPAFLEHATEWVAGIEWK